MRDAEDSPSRVIQRYVAVAAIVATSMNKRTVIKETPFFVRSIKPP